MARVEPQFDRRLIGVWSNDLLYGSGSATDVRILFMPNYSGRYETWHNGLNEVITFHWSPPAADRVTLSGIDYLFRDPPQIRREPCDWHFEAVRYSVVDERVPAGSEIPVLRLHFGPTRVDRYGLMTTDFAGFEEPKF
jgi:hypothetical protein